MTGLPDGKYRLWTEIDEQGLFREASRDNNRTWLDIELRMTPAGLSANNIGTPNAVLTATYAPIDSRNRLTYDPLEAPQKGNAYPNRQSGKGGNVS